MDTVIALLALAVLIVVALWQARTARQQTAIAREQTAIAERLAAIETARRTEEVNARSRARVTASFLAGGPRSRLVLHNEGPALARDVEIEVESLDENPVPTVFGLDGLPVSLQAGQRMPFQVPMAMGRRRHDPSYGPVDRRGRQARGGINAPDSLSTRRSLRSTRLPERPARPRTAATHPAGADRADSPAAHVDRQHVRDH